MDAIAQYFDKLEFDFQQGKLDGVQADPSGFLRLGHSLYYGGSGETVVPISSLSLPCTIELWFYTTTTNRSCMFSNYYNTSNDFAFEYSNNSDQKFLLWDDSGGSNLSSSVKSTGQWYHVALVFDSDGNAYLYVDGNLEDGPVSGHNGLLDNGQNYEIGNRPDDDSYGTNGNIREFRLWNVARTQTEIQENMYKRLKGTESGLYIYYPHEEGSGSTLYDKAGSNDGSISGASWQQFTSGNRTLTLDLTTFQLKNSSFLEWHERAGLYFGGGDGVVCSISGGNYTDYTLEAWLNADNWNDSNRREFFSWTLDPGTSPADLGLDGSGNLTHWRGTAASNVIDYDVSSFTGWHHVALVQKRIDGSTVEVYMYVDGELVGSNSGDYEDFQDELSIGFNNTGGSEYWTGIIADARMWSTARTQTQIQQNMRKMLAGNETGLLAYYPMTEGSGTTLVDHADDNDGSFSGSPSWLDIEIETRVSTDGGSTWSSWASAVSGDSIPDMASDVDYVECRQTLTSPSSSYSPAFDFINLYVTGYSWLQDSEGNDWAKRFPIEADKSLIDSKLNHFPVPILLNSSAGKTGLDATPIFDEIDTKRSLYFDGSTSDYVDIPTLTVGSRWTFETWFKSPDTSSNWQTLIGDSTSSGGYILQVSIDDNGDLVVIVCDSSTNMLRAFFTPDSEVRDGNWHHVAGGRDGDTSLFLLLDGEPLSPSYDSTYNVTESLNFEYLGCRNYSGISNILEGNLYNARLWDHARTQEEIQDNMNRYLDGSETGLIACYDFSDKSGSVLTDIAGGNDGDINGCVWEDAIHFCNQLAVTLSDGVTQIYAEIEQWDSINKKAVLWVSSDVFELLDEQDTLLFLYYDANKPGNTDYIGTPGSRTEVWGAYHHVYHMHDPSQLIDSAGSVEIASLSGIESVDGVVGGALKAKDDEQSFDSAFDIANPYAIQVWYKADLNSSKLYPCVFRKEGVISFCMYGETDGRAWSFFTGNGSGWDSVGYANTTLQNGLWYHCFVNYDAGNVDYYLDAVGDGSVTTGDRSLASTVGIFGSVGQNSDYQMDGVVDELRFLKSTASLAWIKADYYAQTDDLLTLYSAEKPGTAELEVSTSDPVPESEEATLRGVVDDIVGSVDGVFFEWGETTSYGNTTKLQSPPAIGETFEATIKDLNRFQEYHFRAVGTALGNYWYGSDKAFYACEVYDEDDTQIEFGEGTLDGLISGSGMLRLPFPSYTGNQKRNNDANGSVVEVTTVTVQTSGWHRISHFIRYNSENVPDRHIMKSWVERNGNALIPSEARCYIRRSDGDGDQNSTSAVFLVNLTAGDTLVLKGTKDHGDGGTTNLEFDHWMNVEPIWHPIAQVYDSTGGQDYDASTVTVAFDTETVMQSPFSKNGSAIEVSEEGWYKFHYTLNLHDTSQTDRQTPHSWLRKNGTTAIVPTDSYTYVRNNGDGDMDHLSAVGFIYLNAGDYVDVQLEKYDKQSSGESLTLADMCWFGLEQIDASEDTLVAYANNTGQGFGSSWEAVEFDQHLVEDTVVFSHDPSTDENQITINEDGVYDIDYQFSWRDDGSSERFKIGTGLYKNGDWFLPSFVYGYSRGRTIGSSNSYGCNSASLHGVRLSAGDTIQLMADGNKSSFYPVSDAVWITIRKVGTKYTGERISPQLDLSALTKVRGSKVVINTVGGITWSDDFEDNDISDWNVIVGSFGIRTDRVHSGSYSIGLQDSNPTPDGQDIATYEPFGGEAKQPTSFEFYWTEESNSNGGGLRFLDEDGNEVMGVGSTNPEWLISDKSGKWLLQPTDSDNYGMWVRVRIFFDWAAGLYWCEFWDSSNDWFASAEGELINNTNIKTIAISNINYASDPWNLADSDMYMWFDDMTFGGKDEAVQVEVRYSADLGQTWSDWVIVSDGDSISGLTDIKPDEALIECRQTLSNSNWPASYGIESIIVFVAGDLPSEAGILGFMLYPEDQSIRFLPNIISGIVKHPN